MPYNANFVCRLLYVYFLVTSGLSKLVAYSVQRTSSTTVSLSAPDFSERSSGDSYLSCVVSTVYLPSSIDIVGPTSLAIVLFFSLEFFVTVLALSFLCPDSFTVSARHAAKDFLLEVDVISG